MARVYPGALYKVTFTEYERGWGSKVIDTEYYNDENEAMQRARDYNKENNSSSEVPNYYIAAQYNGRVL